MLNCPQVWKWVYGYCMVICDTSALSLPRTIVPSNRLPYQEQAVIDKEWKNKWMHNCCTHLTLSCICTSVLVCAAPGSWRHISFQSIQDIWREITSWNLRECRQLICTLLERILTSLKHHNVNTTKLVFRTKRWLVTRNSPHEQKLLQHKHTHKVSSLLQIQVLKHSAHF